MAKKSKTDRQALIEQVRKQQRGADRLRGWLIVGVCGLIAVAILAAAIYPYARDEIQMSAYEGKELAEIGAPASACGEIITKDAQGNQEHVPQGQQVTYENSPPAFGPHWNAAGIAPAPMGEKFYTDEERPELEALVHNLEHGYTLVWYDETVADDDAQVNELKAVAAKFPGEENFRYKFKVVPWTSDDGDAFPDGQHIAYTHWSAGGVGSESTGKQAGVWQYCSEFSGEALDEFMIDYPYLDSPEPIGM